MDQPDFQFPPRASQPLQTLSPERVNGSRPKSSLSTMTAKSDTSDPFNNPIENASPRSSPVRKANLFADYNPNARAKADESAFGGGGAITSPSLPELHAFRSHVRTNSDVQGLVKRFEHLDVRDRDAESNERRKKHEAELRRAQVAREEAESDVKRLREEVRRLKKEGDDGRDRERKVGKRLEVVMEEFTRYKETSGSQSSVYEKEVRKARKEAFKSSSAVLKLQEDLKSTRASMRVMQSNLDMEKCKIQQREQETFDAQYSLVAVQEELEKLKAHFMVVEEEKEALKTSLKEEEIARIAAEGMIALPAASQDDDDLMSSPPKRSPMKRPASPLSDDKENVGVVTKKMVETRRLQDELRWERMRREEAEELADFLQMECQYRCCGCRSTGTHELRNITAHFTQSMEQIQRDMRMVLTPPLSIEEDAHDRIDSAVVADLPEQGDIEMESALEASPSHHLDRSMTMVEDLPTEQTVHETVDALEEHAIVDDETTQVETPRAPHPTPVEPEAEPEEMIVPSESRKVPLLPSSPQAQTQHPHHIPYRQQTPVRTITTTTTIPMQFTPAKPSYYPDEDENVPPTANPLSPRNRSGSAPTFDREAALAAIAYRRGRAKSIAMGHATPKKQMIEGVSKERRDISAPTLGQKKPEVPSYAKSTASVGRSARRG